MPPDTNAINYTSQGLRETYGCFSDFHSYNTSKYCYS